MTVDTAETGETILAEIDRAVVGRRPALTLILTAMLAGGHVLIEDLPGLCAQYAGQVRCLVAGQACSGVRPGVGNPAASCHRRSE